MTIQTPLWKTAIFAGKQQTRFVEFLRKSQRGREYIERLLKGCFDPPTLRFFLSACCGVEQDNWSSLVTGTEPGPSKQDIKDAKRLCINLKRRLDRIYSNYFEGGGPGVYMQLRLHQCLAEMIDRPEGVHEAQERINLECQAAGLLSFLPLQLQVLHDHIDDWYAVTQGGGLPGLMPIRRDALLTHLYVYANLAAGLTYLDLAFLISGTRKALRAPQSQLTALSVKELVGRYRREHSEDAAAMERSVKTFLRTRQAKERANQPAQSYVVALGYPPAISWDDIDKPGNILPHLQKNTF